MKIGGFTSAILGLVFLFWGVTPSQAVVTAWNAYDDFYLSPTATGWGGATSPNAAGSAWGYYAANVNGFGFPTGIGAYFTPTGSGSGSQNLYQYSNVAPLGAGTYVGASSYTNADGQNFGAYGDTFGWGSSLGRYDTAWFIAMPALQNAIWMQPGWLSGGASEGIAPVLAWIAPSAGTYTFTGQFVAGSNDQGARIAIVDSKGTAKLLVQSLSPEGIQGFTFEGTYATGDAVQFQVGSDFKVGNIVGLQVNVIPEPSSATLLLAGFATLAWARAARRKEERTKQNRDLRR